MQYEKQHRGYGNKWRWYYYAQSYFSLAHLACQYLLDSDKKYSKAISSEKSFSSLKYNNRDLIVPIVFNIKHGIEVFLKGIIKQLNIPLPHQEKKGEHGHDIKYLYNKLIDNKAIQNKPDLFKRLNQLIDIIGRWSEDPQNIFCK
ncbi:hypothetical protein HZB94_01955 [Candidatus Falkowbacteria bacterium]|nr:hypothetical protein [Candidatus Falkowbacteria bacterium]